MRDTPGKESYGPIADPQPTAGRWQWFLGSGILAAIVLGLHGLLQPSPQTQLAAIDAARSIPDEGNAAFVYAKLLPESLRPSVLADFNISRQDYVPSIYATAGVKFPMMLGMYPWRDPAFREYVRDHVESFNILMNASEVRACYFPVYRDSGQETLRDVLLRVMDETLMVWGGMAAQVDLNEGRQPEALIKAQVMICMGQHLSQQPTEKCFQLGLRAEAVGLRTRNRYIISGNASPSDLDVFRDSCGSLEDRWDSLRGPLERVDKLYRELAKRSRSMKERFSNTIEPIEDWTRAIASSGSMEKHIAKTRFNNWIRELRHGSWEMQRACHAYYRLLSERKGHRIIIELRRIKNQTGDWPNSLDPLKSALPAEALVDPLSDKPFVYRRAGNAFALYGVGSNGRDDSESHDYQGGDDHPIWLADWEQRYSPSDESQE